MYIDALLILVSDDVLYPLFRGDVKSGGLGLRCRPGRLFQHRTDSEVNLTHHSF